MGPTLVLEGFHIFFTGQHYPTNRESFFLVVVLTDQFASFPKKIFGLSFVKLFISLNLRQITFPSQSFCDVNVFVLMVFR